jgi:hypothetical protein
MSPPREPLVAALDDPHEITDRIDVIGYNVRQFEARNLILYRDYQFETIEPVCSEVIAKAGFVSNAFWIDAKMSGDDLADS